MKIVFLPVFVDIVVELVDVLINMKYFSYEAEAQEYVDELYNDIENKLPLKPKKKAPQYFEKKYGKGVYYAVFKRNKQTSWYVFYRMFTVNEELVYEVIHITNNHVDGKYFNQIPNC